MRLVETKLPGVGVRHDFETRAGSRVAVLTHRGGRRELVLYDRDDPDAGGEVVALEQDESHTLAELLGGSAVSAGAAAMQHVAGVALDWIEVRPSSAAAGRALGELDLRSRTGASIVAIVRGDDTVPAPGPDAVLQPGDVAVAVGTPDGLGAAGALLGAR